VAAEVVVAKVDWVYTDATVQGAPEYDGRNTYSVVFMYKVDGHFYSGIFTTTDVYRDGDTLQVGYDSKDPEVNDLVQKERRLHWIYAGVGILIVIIWIVCELN
jgi:Protein of unknown function (DUF3592)